MKFLLITYFLFGLIFISHAQSEKKLQKLLNKGKYDKVMEQGLKAYQKNTSLDYPFKYMSWASWFKAQSYQKFSTVQWKYIRKSIENFERYNNKEDLSILENKLTLFVNELLIKATQENDQLLLSKIDEVTKDILSIEYSEEGTVPVINKEELFSPFSFTYKEGNYETFFKAENINIPPYLLAKKADDYIGVPYKYAKENPYDGFDCSGFILYVYRQFGVDFPHNSKRIAMLGKTISIEDAQEGDIVCFGTDNSENYKSISHLGMIYKIENDEVKMIHCGSSTGVIVASITQGYWEGKPFYIKRLLTLDQERLLK